MKLFKILFLTLSLAFIIPSQVGLDRATNISQIFFQSRSNDVYVVDDIQVISEEEKSTYYFGLQPEPF